MKGGIPQKLYEDIYEFHYNDIDSLEAILKANKDDMAGIIVTPVGHPNGAEVQMPKPGYLEAVREFANQ